MSIICNKCGRQLADNAKFCGGCGARIGEAETTSTPGVCPVCGSAIPEGVHFCTVCGTAFSAGKQAADEQEVTMDELIPPVITDDLFDAQGTAAAPSVESVTEAYTDPIFANNNNEPKQPEAADEPTVESVTEVYTDPIFANNNNVPKGYAPASEPETPVVIPESPTPAVVSESVAPEVSVPETPIIDDSAYRQAAQPKPDQPYQPQGFQQPSAVPNGYQNPQQPQYQPYPDPRTMQVKAGSSGGILVPIILIILILAVIAFDVFYLFRDRIFGSDDDSSKSSKEVFSVVTLAEDCE